MGWAVSIRAASPPVWSFDRLRASMSKRALKGPLPDAPSTAWFRISTLFLYVKVQRGDMRNVLRLNRGSLETLAQVLKRTGSHTVTSFTAYACMHVCSL